MSFEYTVQPKTNNVFVFAVNMIFCVVIDDRSPNYLLRQKLLKQKFSSEPQKSLYANSFEVFNKNKNNKKQKNIIW